jgi:hypothetical protein
MTLSQLVTLFDQWNRTNREPGTAAFYRSNLEPLELQQVVRPEFRRRQLPPPATQGSWHRIMSVQRP